MKAFCFTVDDNIRVLRELNENGCGSIFEHPYLAAYKRLHEKYGLKVQLNLFYRDGGGFELSQMSDRYRSEWEKNSDWLKLSFHSDRENERPYEFSGYGEVLGDIGKVNREIVRFASPSALARTATVHYCLLTEGGLNAVKESGTVGLLGLFGDVKAPRTSYGLDALCAERIRGGETVWQKGIAFASIDIILNLFSRREILERLDSLFGRDVIRVMIHEQYFYGDYAKYQPDFEEKLDAAFAALWAQGYESRFFEETL